MTWMPDHGDAPHGRRHDSPPRSTHHPDRAEDLGFDGLGFDTLGRRRRGSQRQMGIPRILGRRARWVGARLRRET
ncbi:hypothetical protein [Kitasatospora sp. SUK 42]|uniref:hypothetical protein n=1 Tax=Kitasatospora sp. SUK 42 TaxID=1588882 RepID=UPI0018C9C069|nr:hypothetical protein [Kitasatospora sp. SUK 42]MBV2154776.1 hypothetical protein [Kitasatospora sp. SUK 42]